MKTEEIKGKISIEDQEVFVQVGEIMEWYYKQANKNPDIDKLLRSQDRLCALSYNVAHIAGELKSEYNSSYFIKKIEFNVAKQTYMNSGKNGTASDAAANIKVKQEIKNEKEAEAIAYKIDLLLKQINKVISAMQQRISYLKQEKGHSNPNTHA